MMVYVTHPDTTDKETRKLEDVVFKSEQLAIGAKFFDTVRISQADADKDRILAEAGRGAPRIVFLNRDFTVAQSLDGHQLSAGRITRAMDGVVRTTYENDFDRTVKAYVKLLTRLDGLESVRQRITDKRARLADKPSASALRKVERDQKEYDEELAQWRKEEQELFTLRLKGAAPAEA